MFAPTARRFVALPVSLQEFRDSLASIWLPRLHVQTPRLGLAVSGGVDSMALATLAAELSSEIDGSEENDVFTAFIVDHQLRQGSDEEASLVQRSLDHLGIDSEILRMQWPADLDTRNLPNVETLARRLRYRLLGTACRDHGIEALLVAHHSDDQAETVMMRLLKGHHGEGLRGIKPSGDIPECYGIHGVHQSYAEWFTSNMAPAPQEQHGVDIEHWGIQVLRPLLPFSKERLTATCKASATSWVEDHTNKDRTLTLRNAVRHVYDKYKLPTPLGKPALLQLSERANQRIRRREEEVQRLAESLDAVLDVRSGQVAILFHRNFYPPSLRKLTTLRKLTNDPWDDPSFDFEEGKMVAAMLVRHLATLVSPRESIELSSLHIAVHNMFPSLFRQHGIFSEPIDVAPFTAGGVHFERTNAPSHLFPYYTWMLSRQPYLRNESPIMWIPPLPRSDLSDDSEIFMIPPETSPEHPQFELYDGRWWLRVYNPSEHDLIVRPLRPDDLKPFRASLQGTMHERFEALLQDAAKAKSRFTLPVIAAPRDPEDESAGDYVVALPTFGVRINAGPDAAEWESLRWNVRYRRMDIPTKVRDTWDDYPIQVGKGRERQVQEPEQSQQQHVEPHEDVPFVLD
ncbi:PP-loop family-domain-containing protein [Phyllosticta citricarpa]|uniref:tRNA(Ile)-lysidine synthetase n=1 Tax=Phyllosticta citricarpa TaxID=55181 RepID=A0ABR1LHF4_9PEZI